MFRPHSTCQNFPGRVTGGSALRRCEWDSAGGHRIANLREAGTQGAGLEGEWSRRAEKARGVGDNPAGCTGGPGEMIGSTLSGSRTAVPRAYGLG